MKILAIETSCDDTCAAILRVSGKKLPRFNLLSNIISSQVEVHKKWGGVYPNLAKREHQKNLAPVLEKALADAKILSLVPKKNKAAQNNKKLENIKKILAREEVLLKQTEKFLKKYEKPKIDAVAVTVGPGLEPCLWVGVNFARALAYFWGIPIIAVNHIEAHILANWLKPIGDKSEIALPAMCLVISGGHTQLILMENIGEYKIVGETRDDAAGECFDKIARILGLGYPGGPIIAKLAKSLGGDPAFGGDRVSAKLPRPMMYQKNYDFSFSGLKTAVLYLVKKLEERKRELKKEEIQIICKEAQQSIIDVLIYKTLRAARDYGVKTIILGGGVSSNEELQKQFRTSIADSRFGFLAPPRILCTDNAAMVAAAAYYRWLKGEIKSWDKTEADSNLRLA